MERETPTGPRSVRARFLGHGRVLRRRDHPRDLPPVNADHHAKLLKAVAWLRKRDRYVLDHAKNPDGNAVSWVPQPDAAKEAVRRESMRTSAVVTRMPARLRKV